jgi:hypothetical protein
MAPTAAEKAGPTAPAALAILPPGIGAGGAGLGQPQATHYVEFSVDSDGTGWWTAKTPAESAKVAEGNPHPGASALNPAEADLIYPASESPSHVLDLGDYVEKGWQGLGKKFIAYQGGNSLAAADDELSDAMDKAEAGDSGALKALQRVGVHPPAQRGGGVSDFLKGLFG